MRNDPLVSPDTRAVMRSRELARKPTCCFNWLLSIQPCSMEPRSGKVGVTVGRRSLMVTGRVSSPRIPSVDPENERAAADVVRDPDAYFERQRALREREAEEYVKRELARASLTRRHPSVWATLARLSHC